MLVLPRPSPIIGGPTTCLRLATIIRASSSSSSLHSSSPSPHSSPSPPSTTTVTSPSDNSSGNKKKPYVPRDFPVSPVIDPTKYIKYSRRHPKAPAPSPSAPLSAREDALRNNPYARILATNVRQEIDYHRRLPSFFLIRFATLLHPETGETWLVPDRIRKGTEKRKLARQGRYAMGTMQMIALLAKKTWRKLADSEKDRGDRGLVWGSQMPEDIRDLIRGRVMVELERVTPEMLAQVDDATEGEGAEVGCMLDWSEIAEAAGDADEVETERRSALVVIRGKLVPLHNMKVMLGDKRAQEVRDMWGVKDGLTRIGLRRTRSTLESEIWLMKLRVYLGIW